MRSKLDPKSQANDASDGRAGGSGPRFSKIVRVADTIRRKTRRFRLR